MTFSFSSIRFFTLLLFVSVAIGVAGWAFLDKPYSFFYSTIVFLFLGTAGGHIYAVEVKKRIAKYFAPLYLFIVFAKVLVYGGYALYIIRYDAEQAVPNIIFFLVIYFVFTILEGYFLYRELDEQGSR